MLRRLYNRFLGRLTPHSKNMYFSDRAIERWTVVCNSFITCTSRLMVLGGGGQNMALLVLPLFGKLRNELSFKHNILRRLPGEEYSLI
jgi:hypothetical protein